MPTSTSETQHRLGELDVGTRFIYSGHVCVKTAEHLAVREHTGVPVGQSTVNDLVQVVPADWVTPGHMK